MGEHPLSHLAACANQVAIPRRWGEVRAEEKTRGVAEGRTLQRVHGGAGERGSGPGGIPHLQPKCRDAAEESGIPSGPGGYVERIQRGTGLPAFEECRAEIGEHSCGLFPPRHPLLRHAAFERPHGMVDTVQRVEPGAESVHSLFP